MASAVECAFSFNAVAQTTDAVWIFSRTSLSQDLPLGHCLCLRYHILISNVDCVPVREGRRRNQLQQGLKAGWALPAVSTKCTLSGSSRGHMLRSVGDIPIAIRPYCTLGQQITAFSSKLTLYLKPLSMMGRNRARPLYCWSLWIHEWVFGRRYTRNGVTEKPVKCVCVSTIKS